MRVERVVAFFHYGRCLQKEKLVNILMNNIIYYEMEIY